MDDQELRTLLEQLHQGIESEPISPEKLELLRELDAEIRALLAHSEKEEAVVPLSSVPKLEDSIEYFEVTHPTLATTIRKILAFLGNMGI
jgi:hypothetical protein